MQSTFTLPTTGYQVGVGVHVTLDLPPHPLASWRLTTIQVVRLEVTFELLMARRSNQLPFSSKLSLTSYPPGSTLDCNIRSAS